ncbi:hypothetical protein D0Z07_2431 [Hyphodiscus hymeniophilus]|uniref:Uncharacterized protein n=1 Tax=Hyphodiscus hymeniophilus TaxID=353542 RepID=A0A9P6VMU8_9HELO|nr:hypothetical protein D0Z07_2431 [Hyphodiscus hymeniophilus]
MNDQEAFAIAVEEAKLSGCVDIQGWKTTGQVRGLFCSVELGVKRDRQEVLDLNIKYLMLPNLFEKQH